MILLDTTDTVVSIGLALACALIAGAGIMLIIGLVGLIRHFLTRKADNDD